MRKNTLILLFFCLISIILIAQETGTCSYYGNKLKGHRVSNGSRYHPDSLTCAHRTYPFGSLLLVKNLKNGNITVVKVTDRGPHVRGRIVDVSMQAAKELGMVADGIARVQVSLTDFQPEIIRLLKIPQTYISTDSINIPEDINASLLHKK